MNANNIKWGILGAGKIAAKFVHDLHLVDQAIPYAVASRDIGRSQKFASSNKLEKAYGNYRDLFSDPEIDIIYIATTHNSHSQWAIEALESGKAVLCEKPLAVNLKQATAIIDASRKHNNFFMEALWTRFNPSIVEILNKIESGQIGAVKYINADFYFSANRSDDSRTFNMDLAGGALLDIGIYPIFLAYVISGLPERIIAASNLYRTGADLQTSIILTYPDRMAVLSCGFNVQSDMTAKISGSKGSIHIDSRWHEAKGFSIVDGSNSEHYDFPTPGNGFTPEIRECHKYLSNDQIESERWSHTDSINLITIMDEIRSQIGLKYPFE